KLAVLWLGGHFQTLAVNIEQPTMIGAPQSAIFDIAVFQRRAAVRTMLAEQSQSSGLITKQHQLLPENFHRLRNVIEITANANAEPIAAQPLSARRPGAHMRNIGRGDFFPPSFQSLFHRFIASTAIRHKPRTERVAYPGTLNFEPASLFEAVFL